MAFVAAPAWQVSLSFRDNNANTASTSFFLPGTLTDYADALAGAVTVRGAIVSLSDAFCDKMTISRAYYNDATDPKNASSEVERKASFSFTDSTGRLVTSIEVPSPIFTVEVDGTDVLNISEPAVAAVIAAMTNGSISPGNGPVTISGSDVTKYRSGRVIHRNRKARR